MAFSQGSEMFEFDDDDDFKVTELPASSQHPGTSKRRASPSTNQEKKVKRDNEEAELTKVLLNLEDLDVPLKDLTFTVTSSSGKVIKVVRSELFVERTWDPPDTPLGAVYNGIIKHFKEKYPDKLWDSIGPELGKTDEFKALMKDWEKHRASKPRGSWEGVTPMEILYRDKDKEFMVGVNWSDGTLRCQIKIRKQENGEG